MTEFELQDDGARVPARPARPAPSPFAAGDAARRDERVLLQEFLKELDTYYTMVKLFEHQEPDEVLQSCSGISARLVEIRAILHRSGSARAQQLRSREVEPLMEEIREQFKIHSRLQSIRELDWKMSGGAPS